MVFIAGDTLRHQPMGSWSHDCSSSAGLLDSYPALVLYLAGVALHQQPMGSRSHDCSSYVGCGGIPCSILVSPNASLHKWQQAVAPGWLPYMVPQNWIQARTQRRRHQKSNTGVSVAAQKKDLCPPENKKKNCCYVKELHLLVWHWPVPLLKYPQRGVQMDW